MRIALIALLLGAVACTDDQNPCDEYVSYMCDCHPDNPDATCDDLKIQYQDPSTSLQDECAIALEDQQAEDADNGHDCGSPEDTGA